MIVYRVAKWQYLEDFSGTGARIYGGRWNREGHAMLYTSAYLSLCVLELLANQNRLLVDEEYGFISIEIPDQSVVLLDDDQLNETWRNTPYDENTVGLGTEWLKRGASLGMIVPSAVLHQENNILINPLHRDFSQLEIKEKGPLALDGRI